MKFSYFYIPLFFSIICTPRCSASESTVTDAITSEDSALYRLPGAIQMIIALELLKDHPGYIYLTKQTGLTPLTTIEENAESIDVASFNYDVQKIVTHRNTSIAKVWDSQTGKCLYKLSHVGDIGLVAWSHDHTLLAVASGCQGDDDSDPGESTIRVWNLANGELLHELETDTDPIIRMVFSPDDKTLALAADCDSELGWDLLIWTMKPQDYIHELQDVGIIDSLYFSTDSTHIVTVTQEKIIDVWVVKTGEHVRKISRFIEPETLSVGLSEISNVIFSDNGWFIAHYQGSGDKASIDLWDLQTDVCRKTLKCFFEHDRTLDVLQLNADATQLLVVGESYGCGGLVTMYDLQREQICYRNTPPPLLDERVYSEQIALTGDQQRIGCWAKHPVNSRQPHGKVKQKICIDDIDVQVAHRESLYPRKRLEFEIEADEVLAADIKHQRMLTKGEQLILWSWGNVMDGCKKNGILKLALLITASYEVVKARALVTKHGKNAFEQIENSAIDASAQIKLNLSDFLPLLSAYNKLPHYYQELLNPLLIIEEAHI